MKIIVLIVTLILVGCETADATNTAGEFKKYSVDLTKVKPTKVETVVIDIDDMTFEEAFAMHHVAQGEGHLFIWRGDEYTTDLAETLDEFVQYHANTETQKMEWVLNNDDPDDYCYWNRRDECGVCNGTGKTTWWRDKDGDGLGDHREPITTCYNPNVEDLREYSGDLGVLGE